MKPDIVIGPVLYSDDEIARQEPWVRRHMQRQNTWWARDVYAPWKRKKQREAAKSRCVECGEPVERPKTGPVPLTCSRPCAVDRRNRQQRERRQR